MVVSDPASELFSRSTDNYPTSFGMDEGQRQTSAPEDHRFAALAREFGPALARYFRRRLQQQPKLARYTDVDDLVQEVLTRLLVRGDGQPIEQPESYLLRAAANVWRDLLRRSRTRRVDDHDEYVEDRHALEDDGPDRVLEGREAISAILASIGELPDRTRHVFVLRRIEGMQQKAVARRLGISVSAVEKHMIRAIRHLADAQPGGRHG